MSGMNFMDGSQQRRHLSGILTARMNTDDGDESLSPWSGEKRDRGGASPHDGPTSRSKARVRFPAPGDPSVKNLVGEPDG